MNTPSIKSLLINAGQIVLAGGAIVFIAFMFIKGMEKQDQADCIKWQEEAQTFQGYYLTEWQAAQCEHYSITVDAPVLKSTN